MRSWLLLLAVSGAMAAPRCGSGAPSVRYLGRVNPATKELTWPGTGVTFSFTGTSASIDIASFTGTNSADLIIDGGAPILISAITTSPITTPAGLAQGNHVVELRRRSEPAYGSFTLGNITTNGRFTAPPAARARQIDIIGDSITVGYGLDGVLPCVNTAELENNPKTYGALAAAALDADYSVIAWSGKGLIRNIASATPDTSPLMPQLYTRYGANDAADGTYPFGVGGWSPAAVVINLGTNDFSYLAWDSSGQSYAAREVIDAAAFADGMVAFVEAIRVHYPAAHFFLLNSPMLSDTYPTAQDAQKTTQTNAVKDAVARLGAKVHFVDWPTQGSDVGCDYHPNAATNAAEADVLAKAIAQALGW